MGLIGLAAGAPLLRDISNAGDVVVACQRSGMLCGFVRAGEVVGGPPSGRWIRGGGAAPTGYFKCRGYCGGLSGREML